MLTGYPVQAIRLDPLREPEAPPGLLAMGQEEQQSFERMKERWRSKHGSGEEAMDEMFAQMFSFKQEGFAMGASTFIDPTTPKVRCMHY